MAMWETVVADVASLMQIMGIDVVMLLLLVADMLSLRSCMRECAKLKQSAAELQALQRLPTARLAEQVMRARGLWPAAAETSNDVQAIIDAANRLVDSYSGCSVFHVLCNSRRIEREVHEMRRRVSSCYALHVSIHAAVAVTFWPGLMV